VPFTAAAAHRDTRFRPAALARYKASSAA
jgi:hypothetical protein